MRGSIRSMKNVVQKLLEGLASSEYRKGIVAEEPKAGEETIHVPFITSSATSLYERMRSLLDNKEQHVIRWHTIDRTLRRLLRGGADDEKASVELLRELVADGFLPNDAVPVSVARKIQYVLLKLRVLESRFGHRDLFRIAVSEIESMLYGNRKEFFVRAFYEVAREAVPRDSTSGRGDLYDDIIVYLACRKAFLEDNEPGLLYGVWVKYFPEWETTTDLDTMRGIPDVLRLANVSMADPAYRVLARKLNDMSVYFLVLKGYIDEHEGIALPEGSERERALAKTVDRLSRAQYDSAQEMGMRAFWYILVTKTTIILPMEYMLTRTLSPPVETLPLAINLVFHPLVLLVMTRTIREPRRVNTDMIVSGVENILDGRPPDAISPQKNRRVRWIYVAIYLVVVVLVFSLLIWFLDILGFAPIGTMFFVILLGIISFFAFRVRAKARRFTLRRYTELYPPNFWFSVVTIPFIDVGRRLSDGFRAINIFTEVMDLFIEVPFKTLVRIAGIVLPFLKRGIFRFIHAVFIAPVLFLTRVKRSFSSFIRDRREEID